MSKADDIPQDVWNIGARWTVEYLSCLDGNSTDNLSEHAATALSETIARAIMDAKKVADEDALSALRAILAISQRRDTVAFNTISDAARKVLGA